VGNVDTKEVKTKKKKRRTGGWWISGFFLLLIVAFTLVAWRAERSGGPCSESSHSESYRCRLIAPSNLPSDYLVIVGMGGVFVAIFTLNMIERQTRSTHHQAVQVRKQTHILEDSVKAALLNAQAFITESRPWLLLHKNMTPDTPHSSWRFEFRIHNFGKTPAKITAYGIGLQIGDIDSPPDPEFFKKEHSFRPMVLPQGEFLNRPFSAMGSHFEEVHAGKKHLWLCGLVRYQDVFESDTPILHETTFCFRCDPLAGLTPVWLRGPEEYNRTT